MLGGITMSVDLTYEELLFLKYFENANSDAQDEAVNLLKLGQQNSDVQDRN